MLKLWLKHCRWMLRTDLVFRVLIFTQFANYSRFFVRGTGLIDLLCALYIGWVTVIFAGIEVIRSLRRRRRDKEARARLQFWRSECERLLHEHKVASQSFAPSWELDQMLAQANEAIDRYHFEARKAYPQFYHL